MINVLFFGPVAERAGTRQIDLDFREGLRWQDVRDTLRARHPEAFEIVSIVAVNGKRVGEQDTTPLADGAEIVFMSAFSGG
ncbi:MAG: MoaD/ThiS family protein [Betaproteobacteria bacterium]|nr:MoaD/ThiS family protein [Betaproteobacteria bacterium]MCL2162515.1 MoaD/ThiS family protein [Betaproteobacteria bacterium]